MHPLKTQILAEGKTIAQWAKEHGYTPGELYNWTGRGRTPRPKKAQKLSAESGVPVDAILLYWSNQKVISQSGGNRQTRRELGSKTAAARPGSNPGSGM